MSVKRTFWSGSLALMVLGACQSQAPSSAGADAGAASAVAPVTAAAWHFVGPATTLASTVSPTRLAFTGDHRGYSGGYRTHRVSVVDGIVEMTAIHHDAVRGEIVGGTATLETTMIARGDQVLGGTAAGTRQVAPDTLAIARGAATEQVINREDGIEQSWTFAQAPQGGGDLVVEVAVSNADFVVGNDSGLHYAIHGGLGFKYSHAVWKDAAGAQFPIQAERAGDRIRLTVPEGLVQGAQYPATLDPTVSAEVFTDSPAIGQIGVNSQSSDVATDGTQYFVVWQDVRDGVGDDIWGTRVSAAGAIVDARGIKINSSAGVQSHAKVTRVTNGYLVAWEDHGGATSDIDAAFVNDSGAVTQLGTIAATATQETAPALAGHGSAALLTWQDGADVWGALYNGTGFGAPFKVAGSASVESEPAVASDASGNYLVTYTIIGTTADVDGQLVTSAGALSGAAFTIDNAAGTQNQSTVAFDGTNFIVLYASAGNINGRRVSTAGALVDATAKVINAATDLQSFPRVACSATGCFAVWQDRRNLATTNLDVYGAVLASDLTVTTGDVVVSNPVGPQSVPSIALAGTQYFATWSDQRDLAIVQIMGARISSAGAVLDANGIVLPRDYSRILAPQTVKTPTIWGIVYEDSLNGYDIKLTRYNSNGSQIDATPKTISSGANSQIAPAVAYIGSTIFSVWQDYRGVDPDIYGSRIDPSSGNPLDPAGLAITTATKQQVGPRIASSGSSALVVWTDTRGTDFDIYGAVIDATGAVTKADFPICAGTGNQTRPAVAYDSTHGVYLVVWSDPGGNAGDIKGARVDTAGNVLDANCGATISGAAGAQTEPAIAFASGEFLVAWEDRRTESHGEIYGARVTTPSTGISVLDPNGLAIRLGGGISHNQAAVTGLNGNFLVAWSDGSNLATTGMDIYAARVVSTGLVEAAFLVSNDPGDERSPELTDNPSPTGAALVVYAKARLDLDSQRLSVRLISFGGSGGGGSTNGGACSNNTQCSSGFCVDSVCCNQACGGNSLTDCQACSTARGASANGTCTILAGPNIYMCRNFADINCDYKEYCDGTNAACPPDIGRRQGLSCTLSGGGSGVCPANDVSGSPHICQ